MKLDFFHINKDNDPLQKIKLNRQRYSSCFIGFFGQPVILLAMSSSLHNGELEIIKLEENLKLVV